MIVFSSIRLFSFSLLCHFESFVDNCQNITLARLYRKHSLKNKNDCFKDSNRTFIIIIFRKCFLKF
uniref:Secreted protein n=1 Tax=Octopus bimaculoides TaxID=37653 RepID=A0A0L8FTI1_OCTBM